MHGQLFTSDFLREGIRETPGGAQTETALAEFHEAVRRIFVGAPAHVGLNEAQTEHEIILPVLKALGWTEYLSQATANREGSIRDNSTAAIASVP